MRIDRPSRSIDDRQRKREALDQMAASIIRQGAVCQPNCSRAASQSCNRNCQHISHTLTSDPERHPIEEGIAPLAFELKRLGVFWPCWSCEGHLAPDGSLLKKPGVWFYAESVCHLRILGECVSEMFYARKLTTPWNLSLGYSDTDNPETTVVLAPDCDTNTASLSFLHKDVNQIATNLENYVLRKIKNLRALI